jgi:hypothetical protein
MILLLRWFGFGQRRNLPAGYFLQQAGRSGEGLPVEQDCDPTRVAEPEREGQREPKVKTKETIHEGSEEAPAQADTESNDQIPGAIFLRKEMSEAPYGKCRQDEVPDCVAAAHFPSSPLRVGVGSCVAELAVSRQKPIEAGLWLPVSPLLTFERSHTLSVREYPQGDMPVVLSEQDSFTTPGSLMATPSMIEVQACF